MKTLKILRKNIKMMQKRYRKKIRIIDNAHISSTNHRDRKIISEWTSRGFLGTGMESFQEMKEVLNSL